MPREPAGPAAPMPVSWRTPALQRRARPPAAPASPRFQRSPARMCEVCLLRAGTPAPAIAGPAAGEIETVARDSKPRSNRPELLAGLAERRFFSSVLPQECGDLRLKLNRCIQFRVFAGDVRAQIDQIARVVQHRERFANFDPGGTQIRWSKLRGQAADRMRNVDCGIMAGGREAS